MGLFDRFERSVAERMVARTESSRRAPRGGTGRGSPRSPDARSCGPCGHARGG